MSRTEALATYFSAHVNQRSCSDRTELQDRLANSSDGFGIRSTFFMSSSEMSCRRCGATRIFFTIKLHIQ